MVSVLQLTLNKPRSLLKVTLGKCLNVAQYDDYDKYAFEFVMTLKL